MRIVSIILTLTLVSCGGRGSFRDVSPEEPNEITRIKEPFKPNERLIHSSHEYITEDGEHLNDYEEFATPYFSVRYGTDTVWVTSLQMINGCGETVADIKISGDTLYLLTKLVSDEACTSVMYDKFSYVIHNPENIEFVDIIE